MIQQHNEIARVLRMVIVRKPGTIGREANLNHPERCIEFGNLCKLLCVPEDDLAITAR